MEAVYKCYYDHEHCFEDISRNSCINIHQIEFYFVLSRAVALSRLPLLLLKSHHPSTFFAISRQIRVHTPCDQKVLESFTANKPKVLESFTANKPLNYWNSFDTDPGWLNFGIGNIFTIIRRFWKVLRQINPYVSNKWPLKLPCAYLNTQESS
ncbi:hypothetical protein T12_6616 [Trichinella patagoniensis]|uniref:Uncharacterized protein n=1 Tax=Trichinella patagoniensis TaxID=990121 RepID=A0A0V1AAA6_9BILA|nr:hypothetical protein T12_6616 [Trichinella patagoniensis]